MICSLFIVRKRLESLLPVIVVVPIQVAADNQFVAKRKLDELGQSEIYRGIGVLRLRKRFIADLELTLVALTL
jgi:hypothetical protein